MTDNSPILKALEKLEQRFDLHAHTQTELLTRLVRLEEKTSQVLDDVTKLLTHHTALLDRVHVLEKDKADKAQITRLHERIDATNEKIKSNNSLMIYIALGILILGIILGALGGQDLVRVVLGRV